MIEVGDGCRPGWIGRRVIAEVEGGDVERAVAGIEALVPVPDGLGMPEAAALLHDGATAIGLVEGREFVPVNGCSLRRRPVGWGVCWCSWPGRRETGDRRGERRPKLDLVRGLGSRPLATGTRGGRNGCWTSPWADRTWSSDGVGGEIGRAAFDLTARGGRFSVHGASSGAATVIGQDEAGRRGVTVFGIE